MYTCVCVYIYIYDNIYIPWRSRKTRTCPGYGKVETRGPGWVHLGTWAPPKVVCGRFVTYIYCYKKPHVCNMHLEAALRCPPRSLLFFLNKPTRTCPGWIRMAAVTLYRLLWLWIAHPYQPFYPGRGVIYGPYPPGHKS